MKQAVACVLACILAGSLCLAATNDLDTFVLTDGTTLQGKVLRTHPDGKIILKTRKGVATYMLMQFDEDTRGEHFEQLENEIVRRRLAAQKAAEEAARTGGAPIKPGSGPQAPRGRGLDMKSLGIGIAIGVGVMILITALAGKKR